jgi:type I restriction enzyme, S subunit
MNEPDGSELPSGWELVELSEIAELNPSLDRCIVSDEVPVDFIPMRAVEPEGMGIVNPETRTYGEVKRGYTAFLPGDVIMAKITPCMENGKTCVVPPLPGAACFGSTEFHVLRAEAGIDPRWIAYYLLQHATRHDAQRQMMGGVGQMRVPSGYLESLKIPVPSHAEQGRVLDQLDELLSDLVAGEEALGRARAKFKRYRAAVFKAAVDGSLTAEWRAKCRSTETADELLARILSERRHRWEDAQLKKFREADKTPPRGWQSKYQAPAAPDTADLPPLPEGWCWATVEQCSHLIQYGTSAKTDSECGGIPVLRMGNVRTDGTLDLADLKYLPVQHHEFPDLLLEEGDLLFNRTNSAELVGKTGLYRGVPFPCSFASYLIRLRLAGGVSPEIVAYALNGGLGRAWIKRVVTQMVGQANVNGSKLAAFAFPLPPRDEQAAIVECVEDQLSVVEHLEADLETKLTSAQALRQSVLRRAFRGLLVAQHPSDESASELLQRIAADREARAERAKVLKRIGSKAKMARRRATNP